jgi:hypothetical protein
MTKKVFISFDRAEFVGTAEAAERAGVAIRTVREWCAAPQAIGRKIAGRWYVSQVALDMLLNGDKQALAAYRAGDRSSDQVRSYFLRRGIGLASAATVSAASADYAHARD